MKHLIQNSLTDGAGVKSNYFNLILQKNGQKIFQKFGISSSCENNSQCKLLETYPISTFATEYSENNEPVPYVIILDKKFSELSADGYIAIISPDDSEPTSIGIIEQVIEGITDYQYYVRMDNGLYITLEHDPNTGNIRFIMDNVTNVVGKYLLDRSNLSFTFYYPCIEYTNEQAGSYEYGYLNYDPLYFKEQSDTELILQTLNGVDVIIDKNNPENCRINLNGLEPENVVLIIKIEPGK